MKKPFLYLITVAVFFSNSVNSCMRKDKKQMTMTINKSGRVTIGLYGSGTVTITSFNLENETAHKYMYSHDYFIISVYTITITGNNITHLISWNNQLTGLDVTKNTALTYLECYMNQLTSLDVSKNFAMTGLYCQDNQLTRLDVSNNTVLTELFCWDNQLISLDVSDNIAMKELACWNNQLTSLDLSNNTKLESLTCDNNKLTNLNVNSNTVLIELSCQSNLLTNLEVSENPKLMGLWCQFNQLKTNALNNLFDTLPSNNTSEENTIHIGGNPGTDNCDQSIATSKGWTVNVTTE